MKKLPDTRRGEVEDCRYKVPCRLFQIRLQIAAADDAFLRLEIDQNEGH